MKKVITSIGTLLAMLIMLETQAIDINTNDARQKARIIDGVLSGELTQKEAAVLRKEQRLIHGIERRVGSDGVVTRREAKKLAVLQNRASRNIRYQKSDRQVRRG